MKRSAKKASRKAVSRFLPLFESIIKTMETDYIDYEQIPGIDKARYINLLNSVKSPEQAEEMFVRVINCYLSEFKNRQLRLAVKPSGKYKPYSLGFRARCFENCLYVTEVTAESRLTVGDRITELDGKSIEKIMAQFSNCFFHEEPERQLWNGILKGCQTLTVLHSNGAKEKLTPGRHPGDSEKYENQFKWLNKDIAYLKLEESLSDDSISKLFARRIKKMEACEKMILDLRKNIGGLDTAFFPLFHYITAKPTTLVKIIKDPGMYTNYTKSNCDLRRADIEFHLNTVDEESKTELEAMLKELKKKEGKGLVFEKDIDLKALDHTIDPAENMKKIIIITDTFCENSAEVFTNICKASPKVTVIGRPTMGSTDYYNLLSRPLNSKYAFIYPMSRSAASDKGKSLQGTGVTPNIYIPWSPEELERDILLEKALELL